MDKIFNVSRPKGFLDGAYRGSANIATGVVGGAAVLVSSPFVMGYQGMKQEGTLGGLKGFAKGLGAGIAGGAAMSLGGIVTGCGQLAGGVYYAKEEYESSSKGMDWDPEERRWYLYDFEEEAKKYIDLSDEEFLKLLVEKSKEKTGNLDEAPSPLESNPPSIERPARIVADMKYYNLLDVPSNATPAEIRKAYYLKARNCHPDRNQGDPEAHAKFQLIGEAYQVLSDEKLRAAYDSNGSCGGLEADQKMNAESLYFLLFGSDLFVPYIGELELATKFSVESENEPAELAKFRQRKRQLLCTRNLIKKIASRDHDDSTFKASLLEECAQLSHGTLGSLLVDVISSSYLECVRAEEGGYASAKTSMDQTYRGAKRYFSMAKAGLSSIYEFRRISKSSEKSEANHTSTNTNTSEPDATSETEKPVDDNVTEKSFGEFDVEKLLHSGVSYNVVELLWHIMELDIRRTLKEVCRRLLHDHSVSEEIRRERRETLFFIGQTYQEYLMEKKVDFRNAIDTFTIDIVNAITSSKEASTSHEDNKHANSKPDDINDMHAHETKQDVPSSTSNSTSQFTSVDLD